MRLYETNDIFPFLAEGWEEDDQERVDTGAAAQEFITRDFRKKIPSKVEYVAPRGSQKTDIIMMLKTGQPIHIESKVAGARITAYDKSIGRGEEDPLLDWITRLLPDNKHKLSFTQYVDAVRQMNKKVGFPGDPGVAKSGKPPKVTITDPKVLSQLRRQLKDRYLKRGDNYLALVTPGSNNVRYFYIGGPMLRQLHPEKIPAINRAVFDTYGYDAKSGLRMRAAIKVFLDV
jgi:hypothetical protein